jgi:hypothetical protein
MLDEGYSIRDSNTTLISSLLSSPILSLALIVLVFYDCIVFDRESSNSKVLPTFSSITVAFLIGKVS